MPLQLTVKLCLLYFIISGACSINYNCSQIAQTLNKSFKFYLETLDFTDLRDCRLFKFMNDPSVSPTRMRVQGNCIYSLHPKGDVLYREQQFSYFAIRYRDISNLIHVWDYLVVIYAADGTAIHRHLHHEAKCPLDYPTLNRVSLRQVVGGGPIVFRVRPLADQDHEEKVVLIPAELHWAAMSAIHSVRTSQIMHFMALISSQTLAMYLYRICGVLCFCWIVNSLWLPLKQ